ncbi:hypothetical protein IscW_ISCW007015 [Ixodes scapularis]|uniref:Uncharacterized protein n=1 Tax=Ixodes scapularis TaxID=6945 RepID=B7PRI8_IXOSC|nr:hypothetical protein IscW_ISCW007015 [Ixodes scapularis]|eukprot:XP_002399795.1 hypothetical protein IscW_ISCW007015 [Ixodes scapularis]
MCQHSVLDFVMPPSSLPTRGVKSECDFPSSSSNWCKLVFRTACPLFHIAFLYERPYRYATN